MRCHVAVEVQEESQLTWTIWALAESQRHLAQGDTQHREPKLHNKPKRRICRCSRRLEHTAQLRQVARTRNYM